MKKLIRAAAILRAGGLVAFPTETVYGLGADATSAQAVGRLFAAKGRPSTNPLICHVSGAEMARCYTTNWSDVAARLSAAFWPGALTLVLPKMGDIADEATAGFPSVGLRAPAHELTLQLIRIFGKPIAGPSANRSNHISPTTAAHVREELGGAVDIILDGGPCEVGIESTVLDLTSSVARILRPGGISKEQIETVIGAVEAQSMVTEATMPATSPGQHPRHYAPRAPAFRFEGKDVSSIPQDAIILALDQNPSDYARTFYARLREFDAQHPSAIYVEFPPDTPQWTAVRDRIVRATKPLP